MTLPAGDALDVLVAEKVMGWKRGPGWRDNNRWFDGETRLDEHHATPEGAGGGDYYQPDESWSPSTDISAAMEVAERMQRLEPHPWGLTLMNWRYYDDVTWTARFTSHPLGPESVEVCADTAPLAICRAALAAIGGTT